jgi:hypothetical protein
MWGLWITEADPEIGMYIQVEAKNELTGEMTTQEGILAGSFEGTQIMWFLGEEPDRNCPWVAERWRQWLTAEYECMRVLAEVIA